MLLYYEKRLNMRQIAELMGIDKSTVSRTIKRGESRLRRCLRYGAEQLLAPGSEVFFLPGQMLKCEGNP